MSKRINRETINLLTVNDSILYNAIKEDFEKRGFKVKEYQYHGLKLSW